jgi:hypothetical protein
MKKISPILLIIGMIVVVGCSVPPPPETYVETAEPAWKVISLRANLDYDKAWQLLVDHMKKEYDIETLDKGSGHLRSDWILGTADSPDIDGADYKVRITIKFSDDRKKLRLKTDAQYHELYKGNYTGTVYDDYGWSSGSDTKVLDDVYKDLSDLLG